MAETVVVVALKPIVINHYILYPGERRELARSQAEQLIAQRPGFLRIAWPPEAVTPVILPAVPDAPEPEAEQPEPELPSAAKARRSRKEQNVAARRDLDGAA